jgi:hypothetical protein
MKAENKYEANIAEWQNRHIEAALAYDRMHPSPGPRLKDPRVREKPKGHSRDFENQRLANLKSIREINENKKQSL